MKEIIERKKVTEETEHLGNYYELVLNQLGVGICIVNADGTIKFQNKMLRDAFGKGSGKKCYKLYFKRDRFCDNCPSIKAIADLKVYSIDHEMSNERFVNITSSPLENTDGSVSAIEVIVDITERKRVEEKLKEAYLKLKETQAQLIQASKLAALGQIGAGIAHELNQPLTGIRGYCQVLCSELDKENSIRKDLLEIEKQATRMGKIIENIKTFSHQTRFEFHPIDVNECIENTLSLLFAQLRVHNIRVIEKLSAHLPKINADYNQLQQVFLNMITNARDAIYSLGKDVGGNLTLKTRAVAEGEFVEITFSDTGCGIKKESQDKIFDPFFTTKSPGGGVGLGLSISYGIIKDHSGFIDFTTEEKKGTTFRIILSTTKAKPCWDILNCSQGKRDGCSVYKEKKGHYCWLMGGAACRGEAEKSQKTWTEVCRGCKVFKKKAFPPPEIGYNMS